MNSQNDKRPAPRLAIVCPCYNEEATLPDSLATLLAELDEMSADGLVKSDSYVLVANDGSRDDSMRILRQWHEKYPERVRAVSFSTNCGHQNAIMAGMLETLEIGADCVVTIDVDLQDELEAIRRMVEDYREGYDVVYGVKVARQADPLMKRMSAKAFYKLQESMGIRIVYNHADFRLLSTRVVAELARYGERNLYLRGIIPRIGFRSTTVEDHLSPRKAGSSKYTLAKQLRLAMDGITSFSVKPIYHILTLGWIYILVALGIGVYVLVSLISGHAEHGWSSMMLSIWLVGGTILIALGIVGFYVGKIYIEVKNRPRYHIEERL